MPDARVRKVRDHAQQHVGRRDEVGVEDGEELARAARHAVRERAGLVAVARVAADVLDVACRARAIARDALGDDARRVVGRVVEHLDVERAAGSRSRATASIRRAATFGSL